MLQRYVPYLLRAVAAKQSARLRSIERNPAIQTQEERIVDLEGDLPHRSIWQCSNNAVAVAWRLRDHQELQRLGRVIAYLVRNAWLNRDPLLCAQALHVPVEFKGCGAREDEEELAGVLVRVAYLGGARRHALVNDAERGVAQQMPAIALLAPGVVLGAVLINHRYSWFFY